jgi:hypothetical protein
MSVPPVAAPPLLAVAITRLRLRLGRQWLRHPNGVMVLAYAAAIGNGAPLTVKFVSDFFVILVTRTAFSLLSARTLTLFSC